MSLPCLDIFRKDAHGNPVWIDVVPDLNDARHRLSELALAFARRILCLRPQDSQRGLPAVSARFHLYLAEQEASNGYDSGFRRRHLRGNRPRVVRVRNPADRWTG